MHDVLDPVHPSSGAAGSASPSGRRRRVSDSRWLPVVTTPVLLALFVALWKAYVEWKDVSRFVLPPPEDVWRAFVSQITTSYVWRQHIWTTFYETVFGFGIGVFIGVTAGFVVGKSRLVETVAKPFIVATQVVPKIALVPLFILWFGFGPTSKVAISALLAFFPMMTNTAFGVRSVPPGMKEMMTSFRAGRVQRLLKLDLPHTLAYILAGAEVGVVLATIGAIVGEYLGGDRGLGRYVINLQNSLEIDRLYGAIVIMTLFGFVLYAVVAGLRRVLIPWHDSVLVHRADQS